MDREQQNDRVEKLFERFCEGELTADEAAELEHFVAADPSLLDEHITQLYLDAALRWEYSVAATSACATTDSPDGVLPEQTDAPLKPASAHAKPTVVSRVLQREFSVAVAVAIAFVAAIIGWAAFTYLPGVARNENPQPAAEQSEIIAWLMDARNVRWAEGGMPSTTSYKRGERLAFTDGLVQIRYATGAKVVIEGPAEYYVGAKDEGGRKQGTAA
ncbi:MAG: hypothetical protein MI757_18945, partial [Pirellulales bacterium]|nr:hypothetical protein [Pirellulales bacterium]